MLKLVQHLISSVFWTLNQVQGDVEWFFEMASIHSFVKYCSSAFLH